MWVLAAVAASYIALFIAVNIAVPEPYMDEIFHIPQAIKLCGGNYTYDPSITTPPLPYMFSVLFAPFLTCSVVMLRGTVALCGILSTLLLYDIVNSVHAAIPSDMRRLRFVRVACSPLHFFYHALYYTEPTSTLFVLLMLWCHLRGYMRCAGLFGAISVFSRQFNIIWVFGSAMDVLLGLPLSQWISLRSVASLWVHGAAGLSFVAFVYWNQSVALGHQEYHGGTVHFAMVIYCLTFMLVLSGQWKPRMTWMALPLLSLMGGNAIAHPFLLSDNRHIAFTLWRRMLQFSVVRQGILPLALCFFLPDMNRRTLLFLLCTSLTVCLTPLLEPRYFLLPCLLAVVFQPAKRTSEWIGLGQCVGLNCLVLGLFFGRTFEDIEKWGAGTQRILW